MSPVIFQSFKAKVKDVFGPHLVALILGPELGIPTWSKGYEGTLNYQEVEVSNHKTSCIDIEG